MTDAAAATARAVAIETVADGVLRIALPAPFPPGTVNAYAFEDFFDGRRCWTVIDSGLRTAIDHWPDLLAGALAAHPVGRIIATHHHPDHIGAAGWLAQQCGAPIWSSRTAFLYARMLQLDAWTEPPVEAASHYRRLGYDDAAMDRWRRRARTNFSVTVAPLPLSVRAVAAGERIDIGDRSFRVAFGQGHAPDHLVLIDDSGALVVAGDQILPRITPNIGVYPTEPEADPLGDWMKALVDLTPLVDDAALILPGHGAPFHGGRRRMAQMLGGHRRRLDRLRAHLAEPRRLMECFPALYRREISPDEEGLATNEALAHLTRLTAQGWAVRRTGDDGVYVWRAAA